MVSGKSYVEMGVSVTMMVLGLVWLSLPITPSLAQPSTFMNTPICWVNIGICIGNAGINVMDPNPDFSKCCSVIKKEAANATCFCSMKDYYQNIPKEQQPTPAITPSQIELSYNNILDGCKIGSTFDQLCNGISLHSIFFYHMQCCYNFHIYLSR